MPKKKEKYDIYNYNVDYNYNSNNLTHKKLDNYNNNYYNRNYTNENNPYNNITQNNIKKYDNDFCTKIYKEYNHNALTFKVMFFVGNMNYFIFIKNFQHINISSHLFIYLYILLKRKNLIIIIIRMKNRNGDWAQSPNYHLKKINK